MFCEYLIKACNVMHSYSEYSSRAFSKKYVKILHKFALIKRNSYGLYSKSYNLDS